MLIGLGIRHLGQVGSTALARACRDIDAVMDADEESLAAVDGVGPVIAASVVALVRVDVNRSVVERLRDAGLHLEEPDGAAEDTDGTPRTLEGRSVVVTGSLDGYTREEAEAAVLARGGKSPGTVSAKTYAVVVGRAPGASKVSRAEQLGIPVVPGENFTAVPGHRGAAGRGVIATGRPRTAAPDRTRKSTRSRQFPGSHQISTIFVDDLVFATDVACKRGVSSILYAYRFIRSSGQGKGCRFSSRSAGASGGVGSTVPVAQARGMAR